MNKEELKKILESHLKWIEGESGGIRANLSEADLSRANLRGANLRGADLRGADLRWANLRGADLRGADLSEASLSRADLSKANLSEADLSEASLSRADLSKANLSEADLSEASLSRADLSEADLSEADLRGADLRGADLSGANLKGVKNLPCFQICPEEGSFTAFKKVSDNTIAKLLIPENAKRVNSTGRKCRCEFAKVVEFYDENKKVKKGKFYSSRGTKTVYVKGKIVRPDSFNDDIREECTNGIHFFLTFKEAADY